MFRKTITIIAVAALAATSLFAANTYESGLMYYANESIDASDEYVAQSREATIEFTAVDGSTYETKSASATYALKNYGRNIQRSISGDSEVFALLDSIYDGYVMTPFNDAVISYDYDQLDNQVVDGIDCDVYEFEAALDSNSFFAGSRPGQVLGYDNADDDYDGDVIMTVYLDATTGQLVRQVAAIEVDSTLSYTQTTDFTSFEADGDTITVPATVVTEGQIKNASGAVTDVTSFKASETFSDYALADGWHD